MLQRLQTKQSFKCGDGDIDNPENIVGTGDVADAGVEQVEIHAVPRISSLNEM